MKAKHAYTNFLNIKEIILGITVFVCTAFFFSTIPAQKIYAEDNSESFTWYDGSKKRKIKIIPDMVAEFSANHPAEKSVIKKEDANARVISSKHGMHIWKISQQPMKKAVQRGQIPATLKGKFSPLFKDSSGRKRALPGNIIVYLDKSWDQEKVYSWAKSKNIEIIKCISAYLNAYLIKTPPGLESLNIANKLYGTPGVVSASPNWWKEVSMR